MALRFELIGGECDGLTGSFDQGFCPKSLRIELPTRMELCRDEKTGRDIIKIDDTPREVEYRLIEHHRRTSENAAFYGHLPQVSP